MEDRSPARIARDTEQIKTGLEFSNLFYLMYIFAYYFVLTDVVFVTLLQEM